VVVTKLELMERGKENGSSSTPSRGTYCVRAMAPPRFAERARIVLACAGGAPNARVAADVGVTVATVRK
jgi:hypothetical protein